ncbi:HAD family hydrolase [Sciscionella sediminilitoris]|uniref:HAD family hydrolase n=1 Tax=Sciscionella sediminilitoris TaxID=1445613 RepID=UPI0004DEF6A7|nr:HAD family hydrolase [Sciscionella sp. SE31]
MEQPLLIASDVDGTLLDDQDKVGARTRAAITRVVASGTPFVLATGRPPRWIPWIAEEAGIDGHAVCCNGSVHYDIGKDRILGTHTIAPGVLEQVTERLRAAIPSVNFAVERIGERAEDPGIVAFLTEPGYTHPWDGERPRQNAPTPELTAQPCVKLLARSAELSSSEMAGIVRGLEEIDLNVTYSANYGLIEFSASGVTKATGLAHLAAEHGVAPERVLAFGDMPNDIEMLRWAGNGIAMGNAHDAVLEVADEVTASNNEDGIAEILERWF